MTTTVVDRVRGAVSSLALKAPVKAATTAAITLSGLQTLDGVSCVEEDRVLVKNQADAKENGIYIVSATTWDRAPDFDGARDVVQGTRVYIASGTAYTGMEATLTTENPVIGITNIEFTLLKILDESISAYVEIVADNIADLNTCSDNIATIIAAPTEAAAAATSAENAATSELNAAASALSAQVAEIDWKNAWSAGTYYARDAVAHNGSSWIVKTTSASTVQEPSLGASDWELLASKGTDGAGTGDVVSTVTASIDGEIVLFNSTTGKSVKRGNTLSGIAKLTSGVVSAATSGTDYSAGTSALATGILKSTTSTGALSIATSADIPNPTTTRGDIIYRNATGWTRLAAGTAGYVLTMGAADPAWAAPAIQGSRVLIATKEASASASITFTEFTSSYDIYEILWIGHLAATTDTYLNMHFSVDGGSNWLASGIYWDCYGVAVTASGNNAAVMTLMDTGSYKQTNSAGYLGSGTATIMNINSTSAVNVIGANVYWNNTSNIQRVSFGGSVKTTGAINAIKFQESSGNIASGKFYLYGVRTS